MSLQTKLQCDGNENRWKEDDLLKRNILYHFTSNGYKKEAITKNKQLCRAVRQFSWFHIKEQQILYDGLHIEKIRDLAKYLKEINYNDY